MAPTTLWAVLRAFPWGSVKTDDALALPVRDMGGSYGVVLLYESEAAAKEQWPEAELLQVQVQVPS